MRKTRKAASASNQSGKAAATPLKARSLADLRDLQRQAGTDPAPAPTKQTRQRAHRFLPPRPGPVMPAHPASSKATHDRPDPADTATPASQPSDHHLSSGPTALPENSAPTVAVDSTLSPADIALFHRVMEHVAPGPKSDRRILAPVPPATPSQLRQRRQQATGLPITPALDVSDHYASGHIEHDDTMFLQAGQGPHLIKGLKKGKWPVQASLDLHGSTLDDARERLDRFIQSCRDHGIRCVRIVHGKGYGSKDGSSVLKETVRRWLSQLAIVQAYVESDEANGGAGAVLVLLSKTSP